MRWLALIAAAVLVVPLAGSAQDDPPSEDPPSPRCAEPSVGDGDDDFGLLYLAVQTLLDGTGPPLSNLLGLGVGGPVWRVRVEGVALSDAALTGGVGGLRLGATFARYATPATELRIAELTGFFASEPMAGVAGTLIDARQYLCRECDGHILRGYSVGCPASDAFSDSPNCGVGEALGWHLRVASVAGFTWTRRWSAELVRAGLLANVFATGRQGHARAEALEFELDFSLNWSEPVAELLPRGHQRVHFVASLPDRLLRIEATAEGTLVVRPSGAVVWSVEAELRLAIHWYGERAGLGLLFVAARVGTVTDPDLALSSVYDGHVRADAVSFVVGLEGVPFAGVLSRP